AEGIVVQNTRGEFTFVNPAAGAMLGYEHHELVGEHWTRTVPADQHHIVQAADERRRRHETDRYVVDLLHRDGSRFPVLVSGSSLVDSERGCFDGTIAVFTDISEQVRTEKELARHAQEMAALYETSLEINSQRNLEILLTAIVERASKLLNSSMGGLYLVRPGTRELELVVSHNLPADYIGVRLPIGEGLSGRVAQTGEPKLVADYSRWEGRSKLYEDAAFQRVLAVPMRVGDRVIGVINIVDDDQTEPFHDEELRLVGLFADQAAIAVENARLLEAEREQRELAEALRQAASAVSSTLDLDQILDDILEQVDRVIPGDAASIALIEGETAHTVRSRGYDRFGSSVQGLSLGLPERPNLCFMRDTGEPIIVPDVQEHPGWGPVPEVAWIRSYAGAPIRLRDRVIGFLNVDSATPGFFTAAHADRLRAFADQASLALANADLFHIAQQGKRDWEVTFDAMQDPVALVDSEQRVVRANKAFTTLVDRTLAQVMGEALDSLLQDQDCGTVPCPLEQARQNRHSATCVHEFGGRIFEIQATPVAPNGADVPGLAVRLIYVLRDISERKMAEEEIHHRNRELALLNRIIAASVASVSTDVLMETVCRELAEALGVPRAAAMLLDEGRITTIVVAEYHPAGDVPSIGKTRRLVDSPVVQHLVGEGSPLVVDDIRAEPKWAGDPEMARRGTVSWLLLPLSVQGIVVGCIEVDSPLRRPFSAEEVDLAQRVADQASNALARTQLEETQRRLSAAVEQAAEAVVITDADSTIRYANPAFERITGFVRADVIGQTPRQLRQSEQHASAYLQILRSMTAGQDWQGRLSASRPDNTPYVVDIYVSPVRNQAGETVNYVVTMRDVTREVQLEGQFQQAQKMEALGRLAGGIAHDFNNLLTVIHLSTRLVERQLRAEDPIWEHVQQIRKTGERAAKLTKQLLSFSRREVVDPRVLSVNQVVCDLGRMLQRIIGEDIELVAHLADDLWQVKADPAQIEQVIMNLAVNARDAMPAGGTLTIETQNVSLDEDYCAFHVDAQPGDHVVLTIGDTGEGMDAEVKAHLFEPFFTTKERGQGTGLGLSTVFGIVRQSGGHIRVESHVDRGTRFLIHLPRCMEDRHGDHEHSRDTDEAGLVAGRKTVLVVEDEANVRRLAVRVLDSYGYKVLDAADGSHAMRVSQGHEGEIDLLITDVVMPQMNGKELADRLQRDRPQVLVLYMSGYPDTEIVGNGGLPADSIFLPKPFSVEDLVHKVQSVLEGRS
ncbi:MAG: GAF domain-containing protein, partial [Anaerolineae bacterium]